jgi:NRAMP (natural resistance-associated macrophage protein)-like metal ion transporter
MGNTVTVRKYMRALGPGFITGASDNDPSGVATYAQAGALLGFGGLWTAVLSFPLATGVQEAADRIALATGKGLGAAAREHFGPVGRRVLLVLLAALIVANALNISADLVAVGAGMHLLGLGPSWFWALIAGGVTTALVLGGSYTVINRVFGLLALTLLSYVVVLLVIRPPAIPVLRGTFLPHFEFTSTQVAMLIAIFGTTISPYLFFWQTEHRREDMEAESLGGNRIVPVLKRSPRRAMEKVHLSRFDVVVGVAFSALVMWSIMAASAASLDGKEIASPAEAAKALEPVAGSLAEALFALGFIGTGMLAVPVLAGAGASGMAGLLNRPTGFSRGVRDAPFFYGLVAVGTLAGTLLSLIDVNPIRLLVITAVVNGLASAPFLVVVLLVSRDATAMGELRNGRLSNTLLIATITLMTACAVLLVYFQFRP